jgi:hypothetical protein
MKKYAVCLYSNFDGSMNMDIVSASSQVEAGKKFLASEEFDISQISDIHTYEALQQAVFDWDHAIGVLDITPVYTRRFEPPLPNLKNYPL